MASELVSKTPWVQMAKSDSERLDELEIVTKELKEGQQNIKIRMEEITRTLSQLLLEINSSESPSGTAKQDGDAAGSGAITSGNQFLEPDGLSANPIPNPEDKAAMEAITRAVPENKADLGNIFYTEVDRSAANVIDKAIRLNCVGEELHVAIDKHMFDEMPKRKIKKMLDAEMVNITLENMFVFEGKESRAIEMYCDAFDEILENKLGKNVLEFDRDRKSMAVIVKSSTGNNSLLIKGAVETLLERSSFVQLFVGSVVELDESSRKAIFESLSQMATSALKVLGFAYKDDLPDFATYNGDENHPAHQLLLNPANSSSIESKLIFVGLVGLRDLPRKEVPQAIKDCRTAGIRIMVITGDNKNTAEAIYRGIGVFDCHENISSRSLTDCNNQIAKGSKIEVAANEFNSKFVLIMFGEVAENSQKSCKNKNARCFTDRLHFLYCKFAHLLTAFKIDPGGRDVKDIYVKLNVGASRLYRGIFATNSPSFKTTCVDDPEFCCSVMDSVKNYLSLVDIELVAYILNKMMFGFSDQTISSCERMFWSNPQQQVKSFNKNSETRSHLVDCIDEDGDISLPFFEGNGMLHQVIIEGIDIFNICPGKEFSFCGFLPSSLHMLPKNIIYSNFQVRDSNFTVDHMVMKFSHMHLISKNEGGTVIKNSLQGLDDINSSSFCAAKLDYKRLFSAVKIDLMDGSNEQELRDPGDNCKIPFICGKLGVYANGHFCQCASRFFHDPNWNNGVCVPTVNSLDLPSDTYNGNVITIEYLNLRKHLDYFLNDFVNHVINNVSLSICPNLCSRSCSCSSVFHAQNSEFRHMTTNYLGSFLVKSLSSSTHSSCLGYIKTNLEANNSSDKNSDFLILAIALLLLSGVCSAGKMRKIQDFMERISKLASEELNSKDRGDLSLYGFGKKWDIGMVFNVRFLRNSDLQIFGELNEFTNLVDNLENDAESLKNFIKKHKARILAHKMVKRNNTDIPQVLEELLVQRTGIQQQLKHHLQVAQNRMKQSANKYREKKEYQVGDMVYWKLKPYRQLSLTNSKLWNLNPRFARPFPIIAKVGAVAYRLKLPRGAKIHPVFHVSVLKLRVGDTDKATNTLPPCHEEAQTILKPEDARWNILVS